MILAGPLSHQLYQKPSDSALAEFVVVATGRRMLSKPHAIAQARDWKLLFPVATASALAFDAAFTAFETGRFGLWDALLLATAGEAGCTIVLSEDMQDGGALDGVTVRNPLRGATLPDDLRRLIRMP